MSDARGLKALWPRVRIYVGVAVFFAAVLSIGHAAAPEHCVFGLTGATVSISVDGPGAQDACKAISTKPFDGRTWYVYDNNTQATGPVICQVPYRGVSYVLREAAPYPYGSAMCATLTDLASGSAASP
jgi:hypothetical protein